MPHCQKAWWRYKRRLQKQGVAGVLNFIKMRHACDLPGPPTSLAGGGGGDDGKVHVRSDTRFDGTALADSRRSRRTSVAHGNRTSRRKLPAPRRRPVGRRTRAAGGSAAYKPATRGAAGDGGDRATTAAAPGGVLLLGVEREGGSARWRICGVSASPVFMAPRVPAFAAHRHAARTRRASVRVPSLRFVPPGVPKKYNPTRPPFVRDRSPGSSVRPVHRRATQPPPVTRWESRRCSTG